MCIILVVLSLREMLGVGALKALSRFTALGPDRSFG